MRAATPPDANERDARHCVGISETCHEPGDGGYEGVFPWLPGNPIVEARRRPSHGHIVLLGIRYGAQPIDRATPARLLRNTLKQL
jgi:hypothetical protein